jgi:large subunit ribosomal protein L13
MINRFTVPVDGVSLNTGASQRVSNQKNGDIMDPTRTYNTKASDIEEKWFLIDAENQILGRVATVVASILRGKYNPKFVPHLDLGEHVVVVNADKVRVTGRKLDQKKYYRHTGYFGGIKEETLRKRMNRAPEEVISAAVWGMLPKGPLGRKLLRKLRVYAGPEHKHQAQQPVPFRLEDGK